MRKNTNTIKLIFGFKVKYLRQQLDLSYQQLSDLSGLSLSYIHDIEKGKKYPKADKIMQLAKALEVDYDYLVSLRGSKKLQPIIDILHSDLLRDYPLEMFGLSQSKLLELFSNIPEKINAFISTILTITRNYQMSREHFYQAALRSYQDMHDNYFAELEKAVKTFKKQQKLSPQKTYTTTQLEKTLEKAFEINVDRDYLAKNPRLSQLRSYFKERERTLYINPNLSAAQENFLIGRELGFQALGLTERPYETRILHVKSFDKLLNNFKASYFSAALLMDEDRLAQDFEELAQLENWEADRFVQLLEDYQVTAEMLLQRLTNVLPKQLGIRDLFFLRMSGSDDLRQFSLTKELHLAQQQHRVYSNELKEHYCQRWLGINLIKRLRSMPSDQKGPIADAQISAYHGTRNSYLCLAFAKRDPHKPSQSTSVIIGLLINNNLRQLVDFLEDPALKRKEVNITCERCNMPNCGARVAPPIVLEAQKAQEEMLDELANLEKKK